MRQATLKLEFVEYIPERLSEGTLYVSERYRTAAHLCCCGCGEEVITPLSPADWQLRREDNSVTLHPSIGNWNFTCQSHYWIRRNRVEWAPKMTTREIARVRRKDKLDKARYIAQVNSMKEPAAACQERATPTAPRRSEEGASHTLWQRIRHWLGM